MGAVVTTNVRVPRVSGAGSAGPRSSDTVDLHVGARIRLRRRTLGLSQQALAEALGLTFQQVQKYERGANRVSSSRLYEIARVLSCSVGYFFDGLPDPAVGDDEPEASRLETTVHALLLTPEGLELAALFPRIGRGRLRRQVLEIVRSLAEDAPET